MSCPNCQTPMSLVTLDNQPILHCPNCGGSFFEENGINRINLADAQKLAEDKQTDEVAGTDKQCPKDQQVMKPVIADSVPADVTLLKCPDCRGIFVYPDDLLKFKQAQEVKINYFKLWNIPMPALKAVLIMSLMAAIGISLAVTQRRQFSQTQATDVIKTVHVSRSGPYLFISFRTPLPLISHITLTDNASLTSLTKTVSAKPTKIHYLTTADVDLTHDISYQIVLTDEKGRETKTEEQKLQTSK